MINLQKYVSTIFGLFSFVLIVASLNAQDTSSVPVAAPAADSVPATLTPVEPVPAEAAPASTVPAPPESSAPAPTEPNKDAAPTGTPDTTSSTPADATKPEEDPRRRFAITDLSQVDADYHDQGEYIGSIPLKGIQRDIGLQVVALGEGKFSGMIYSGGLPGNGFDGSTRLNLSGERVGERVVIGGEDLVVYLQSPYKAVVKTSANVFLGYLEPVKRLSRTLGKKPPANAIVLFDGYNTDQLLDAKVTADGLLEVGTETKRLFQSFEIHGEFCIPYMPYARDQDRGNSGFYLQRRYEIQVLDSFGLDLKFNHCGSIYRYKAPDLNMSFPPLRWQTYDITFKAARFSVCGEKLCNARVTVIHNGVVVQNNVEFQNKTGAGKPEGPNPMPILFQNHKNPVRYRNIWIVDHDCPNLYQTGYCQPGCATVSSQNYCEPKTGYIVVQQQQR